jgi:aminopeptidase N
LVPFAGTSRERNAFIDIQAARISTPRHRIAAELSGSRGVMGDANPKAIRLSEYAAPEFLIDAANLDVDIHEEFARVHATLRIRRNPTGRDPHAPLALNGEELSLESVAVDGRPLDSGRFALDAERLVIPGLPDRFELDTVVRIAPRENSRLIGLYGSKDGFFTQCEAEGFRRITYFVDRPDVMARYTTALHADKARYPVLLSNGNLVAEGEEAGGRHWAKWEDPFPKPSYLFAMVAARLDVLRDQFVTRSGQRVALAIYVEPGKLDQCGFAMESLKRAMKWDEDVFGLEVDLDHYMIVAVGDFNSGAMENKGLNIFNTKYVLARADTATDLDFQMLDRVVAHEYCHNWTGNRVTCRDWFQLSLKEGLTVFRDQEYGADHYSRPVSRIREVRSLRASQFAEDAGPMAHPVRPASYIEIRNFYTATVYEKGAELVRMIHTLIGREAFRRGMDLYFRRHDGQAVTCDDFVRAMQDASGVDLSQLMRWYDQAGTPVVEVADEYDPSARRYTLRIRQSCPPTPGQPEKLPFHIPLRVGLVGADGGDLPLRVEGEASAAGTERVFSVKSGEERLVFLDVPARPVPSLLRGFSAPVALKYDYRDDALAHLLAHDSDPFNRWEAGQRLVLNLILSGVQEFRTGREFEVPERLIRAFAKVLADGPADPAFAAEVMALPGEGYIAEQMERAEPDAIHAVRDQVRRVLARALRGQLLATYHSSAVPGPYSPDAGSAGRRALRNACLDYLMELEEPDIRHLALEQYRSAHNMTDAMAALNALANRECAERPQVLSAFYESWRDEPLVVNKWLAVQAASRLPGTLEEVKRLRQHPAFDLKNPNKVYALIRTFSTNQVRFHAADGAGYEFLADQVIALDPLNPEVAARITRGFDRWKKFDEGRQVRARSALERILKADGLSKDVYEVASKALA